MRIRNGGWVALAVMLVALPAALMAQDYRSYEAVGAHLQDVAKVHPGLVTVNSIGKSAGGRDIWMVRIAAQGSIDPEKRPAMFIGANIEGNRLLATEAALATVDRLVAADAPAEIKELLAKHTYYIAPALNPDVMIACFNKPLSDSLLNATKINSDGDLTADEDGPDDLNGDGLITVMRYKDPAGTYIQNPDDPRLMRPADPFKGEKGEYLIVSEGIDNDGDGTINEDPAGGVVINQNFPHDFQYFIDGTGPWPASEPETIALLDFMVNHRTIAIAWMFGSESNLLNLQRGKQAQNALPAKVKVPARFARFLGLDPEQEFTIKELVSLLQNSPFARGMEVTEERVAQMLGGGPAMSINGDDYRYYEEISKRYKEMVKEAKVDDDSRKPKPVLGDGSFASWAYYQYGVPSFAVDLWAVPQPKPEKPAAGAGEALTLEKLKSMGKDEFVALGEEKIAAFLKAQGMEGRMPATRLIEMVQGGQITPAQMAQMAEARAGAQKPAEKKGKPEESNLLDWAEKNVPGGGLVPWTKFNHPTLGEVEIGGIKPMLGVNPPFAEAAKIIAPNVDFAVKLAGLLPAIELVDVQAKKVSDGIYELSAFVHNSGWLPTALKQGALDRGVPPIVVRIETAGATLLAGNVLNRVSSLEGNGRSQKMTWVVKAAQGAKIAITAESVKSGADAKTVVLP